MGFGEFFSGFEFPKKKPKEENEDEKSLEEAYEKTKRNAVEFNKKSEDLARKRQEEDEEKKKKEEEEEEEDRLKKEKEKKEEGGPGDVQGETANEILKNLKETEEDKPKRPGFSKLEQDENFVEKNDETKMDEGIVDVADDDKK